MPSYDPKELKAAVAELNKVFPDSKIIVVGKKTVDVVASFRTKILSVIEEEQTDILPESVIDFYNEHLAEEEAEEEVVVETTPKKTTPKKTVGKKSATKPVGNKVLPTKPVTTKKKTGKKDEKAKARTRDGEGLVAKAVEAYQEKNLRTTKELTAHMATLFPDRNISSTVSHVCCILGHVKGL